MLKKSSIFKVCTLLLSLVLGSTALAGVPDGYEMGSSAGGRAPGKDKVDVIENHGAQLDLEMDFFNEKGEVIKLSSFFNKERPVVFALVYYGCPGTCGIQMNATFDLMQQSKYVSGNDFELVFISFEPKEDSALAKENRQSYIEKFEHNGKGVHFLADKDGNAKKMADLLGFKYTWSKKRKVYDHASVTFIFTETGRISQYLHGTNPEEHEFRIALTTAGEGKIGSLLDKMIASCYYYDPNSKKNVRDAMMIMKIGGGLTLLFVGIFLAILWRGESKKNKENQTKTENNG